jgi:hypothetical protein
MFSVIFEVHPKSDQCLTPGDVILLVSWRDQVAAEAFGATAARPGGARLRRIRVVRDYGIVRPARGAAVLP